MEYALLCAFGLYLSALATITYFFYQKSHTQQEFMLGNRSINYVATAIAAHSSDMSIWLFMGFPGAVYLSGAHNLWLVIGLLIGMYLSWTFMAAQLRRATAQSGSVTLSEYLEHRFNDTSGSLRMVTTLCSLFFFVFYISSGLAGMGNMFESVFKIDYHLGILVSLAAAVAYTFFGGFVGIAWCDLFQGIFLVTMIVFVPVYGFFYLPNGMHDIATYAQLKSISLSLVPTSWPHFWTLFLTAAGWGLGYFGQPHILVNFMGIKDEASVPKARFVGMLWQLFTLGAAFSIGLIGIAFFPTQLTNPELVFVTMVQQLFTPFFAGLVLCAIIAAGLTTIDTQILVTASVFATDIYKQCINPRATSDQVVRMSRWGIILIPSLSYVIAATRMSSVFGLVEFAWHGLGSSFGPVLLMALYSKQITKHAALAGMITGAVVAAFWPLMGINIPPMIPAFFANLCVIIYISHFTK